jgi:hypothetical protein
MIHAIILTAVVIVSLWVIVMAFIMGSSLLLAGVGIVGECFSSSRAEMSPEAESSATRKPEPEHIALPIDDLERYRRARAARRALLRKMRDEGWTGEHIPTDWHKEAGRRAQAATTQQE